MVERMDEEKQTDETNFTNWLQRCRGFFLGYKKEVKNKFNLR